MFRWAEDRRDVAGCRFPDTELYVVKCNGQTITNANWYNCALEICLGLEAENGLEACGRGEYGEPEYEVCLASDEEVLKERWRWEEIRGRDLANLGRTSLIQEPV